MFGLNAGSHKIIIHLQTELEIILFSKLKPFKYIALIKEKPCYNVLFFWFMVIYIYIYIYNIYIYICMYKQNENFYIIYCVTSKKVEPQWFFIKSYRVWE